MDRLRGDGRRVKRANAALALDVVALARSNFARIEDEAVAVRCTVVHCDRGRAALTGSNDHVTHCGPAPVAAQRLR